MRLFTLENNLPMYIPLGILRAKYIPRRHITCCKLKTMKGRVCSLSLNASSLFSAIGKGSCLTMEGGKGGKGTLIVLLLKLWINSPVSVPYLTPSPAIPLPLNSGQQVVHSLVPFLQALYSFLGFAKSRTIPSSKLLLSKLY